MIITLTTPVQLTPLKLMSNEFHVHYEHRSGFGLRALYARCDFSEDNGFDPETFDADDIMGWYIEPSYKTDIMMGQLGVFIGTCLE